MRLARSQAAPDATGKRPVFTSDLSVNEFALLHQAGFEPLGLVMGTSMYQIGYQRAGWTQNMEMDVLTQAMYSARELALWRMQEEADEVQAEGIVGVEIEERTYGWDAHVIEYFAVGTAIAPFAEAQPIPSPTFTISLNDMPAHKIVTAPPTPGEASAAH